MVVLFIAQVKWFLIPILTPDFTMNPKAAAAQGPTYFYTRMTLSLDRMYLYSLLPKLSNLSWLQWMNLNKEIFLSLLRKWSPFNRLLLKWVGCNRLHHYKPTTPLMKELSTTPLYQKKLSRWIYVFTGYADAKLKANSVIIGPLTYSTGVTTVLNIILQLITNIILQYMMEQHIIYIPLYGYICISQWTQYLFLWFQQGCIVTPVTHKLHV